MAKSRGLGRGLDTLFADQTGLSGEDSGISTVRLSEIEPNLSQPRKEFDEEALNELAKMIVSGELSVREAEKLASKIGKEQKEKAPKKKDSFPKDKFYREMQVAMTEELGRPFKIRRGYFKILLYVHLFRKTTRTATAAKSRRKEDGRTAERQRKNVEIPYRGNCRRLHSTMLGKLF